MSFPSPHDAQNPQELSDTKPFAGFEIVRRTMVLRGRKFDFEQFVYRTAAGKELHREVVRHPGAVLIVALTAANQVVLIANRRPTVNRELLECCAGTMEAGEAPEVTAARELIEETGYSAGSLAKLSEFYTSPGLSDEVMHAYFAQDLTHVGQQLEEDEAITVVLVPVAEALAMTLDGRMIDAKSMLCLHLAKARGWLPSA